MKIRLSTRAVVLIGATVVVAVALRGAYQRAEQSHRLAELINSAHNLTIGIRIYKDENGRFPKDLNTLVQSGDLPANYTNWFGRDVRIEYTALSEAWATPNSIIRVRWRGYEISYDRELERTVRRDRTL